MFADDVTVSHDHHPLPFDSLIGNIQQNVNTVVKFAEDERMHRPEREETYGNANYFSSE